MHDFNSLIVALQSHREGPTEVIENEGVHTQCSRLFHLLNIFTMIEPQIQFGKQPNTPAEISGL